MSRNDGKKAEEAFEEYWERRGHLIRFWDQADLRGRNGGRPVGDFPKPADYLVSSPHRRLHLAEVKSTTHPTSLSFGCIRPAQNAAALLSAKKGDRSYVFYIFSYARGQWFYMSCERYAYFLDQGRRSVKFEELIPWDQ